MDAQVSQMTLGDLRAIFVKQDKRHMLAGLIETTMADIAKLESGTYSRENLSKKETEKKVASRLRYVAAWQKELMKCQ